MKVLVTVKEVAEVEDEFEINGLRIDDRYLEYDLNEWDNYAIEEGVQLKEESDDDVEVVVATLGPERSEETIRMALAKGADRAIRVWDPALDDCSFINHNTVSEILAAVVEDENPDLVLTGVQASDDANGATGVALADRLGTSWAAVVNDLSFSSSGSPVSIRRELEGGVEELTSVELPAVLTIQTGINEPRYASLRGIRQAQSKEIASKTLADYGLDENVLETSLTRTDMYKPETESDATIFEGDATETAGQLATLLNEKGVNAQ
ncbi:electron transfer flavoprotein subunit beta/FixA family protein [Haloferax sp. AB510]|uniref:electron transfer flavoprotein subunit beta/FixA family protein n=1 Tax=unclassified Haloferax TaxID=2625095 RepID=UPI0005B1D344|nr:MULTISPECIES: electron transfer flavoprotein subunit beta/FixA family protein [unclassified Haloferax]MCO8265412.1 electron transfer flavoprotein subunit beta/FixA family protein [Haloferax sp. AB510]